MVNGTAWPYMDVQRRVYRFRILLATMSRSMNLRLVNVATGQTVPVHIVATDGGLMPKTQTVTNWRHAGAERYEVLVDFRPFGHLPAGAKFELRNSSAKNNRDYLHTGKVMQFRLSDEPVTDLRNNTVPTTLVNSTAMSLTASMAKRTRRLELKHDDVTNMFNINGKMWDDVQRSGFKLLADGSSPASENDVEIWEIQNTSGGWFHPLHIHLIDFRILSRSGGAGRVQPWEQGPKDVVYLGEGETVRVIGKYEMVPEKYPIEGTPSTGLAGKGGKDGGRYMIHCHNLPHEDNDMMQQFQVGTTPLLNDPINAAKPQP
jgi:FtsP/CotA-like multicopper oxidase with cupredoxin domain